MKSGICQLFFKFLFQKKKKVLLFDGKPCIMMIMKIRNIHFEHGLVLAPMAGVTDRPFRRICRRFGAELTVSEMVSAKALHFGDPKTQILARLDTDEHPAAVQIFGSEPQIMAQGAEILCSGENPPDIIDINMGCPMKKIVNNGEGARLMQNPALAASVIRAVRARVAVPVTVKFRLGWDQTQINAAEFAKVCEDAGADAITIHGRTREQMYAPPVDLAGIAAVKRAVSIPVIGNGDLYTGSDALHMLQVTGVDGIAIARGSMGNPWLFDEIRCALVGKPFTPPSLKERIDVAIEQLHAMIQEKGERVGICEGRRQLAYYIAGLPGSAAARDAINRTMSLDEIHSILQSFLTSSH